MVFEQAFSHMHAAPASVWSDLNGDLRRISVGLSPRPSDRLTRNHLFHRSYQMAVGCGDCSTWPRIHGHSEPVFSKVLLKDMTPHDVRFNVHLDAFLDLWEVIHDRAT